MTREALDKVNQARRSFLLRSALGLGSLSMMELLGGADVWAQQRARDPQNVGALGAPDFAPTAKRVIQLHMLGAISHVDTFDYKPMLEKMHGQEMPESVRTKGRLSTMSAGQSAFTVLGPLAKFKQRGKSGAWVSDLLPHTATIADDLSAERLRVQPGSPLLKLRRVFYDNGDRPVYFADLFYRPDRFEYRMTLSRGADNRFRLDGQRT